MNIAETFIRRPVMTTLLMIGLLIFGVVAFKYLPVSDLPTVDFPFITVGASLPGASPETMASAVATPLEKQFTTIAGIDTMTSSSMQGSCTIRLQFTLDRNIDAAAQDVQAAIAQVLRQLPANMPSPPSYQKVNPADQPFLYLTLTSPTMPLSQLDEYGETLMAQRISTVNGVAQVLVYGAQKYAVRIQLDPQQLAARSLGIDEVSLAVQNANVNQPTGVLYGAHQAFTVNTLGQLETAAAYQPLVVAYRNGSPVRLGEIGQVFDSVENNKTQAWFYSKDGAARSIILAIQKQPGVNTVEVANDVKKLLPQFKTQLPASINLNVLYDRSESIDDSVRDVEMTLVLTLVLVIGVIFLFLRSFRATVIPSLTLPMSIIGTFTVMYLLNYSLDNLSLMALTLAVGFVVDDAIVMLENIVRHMEMGKPRLQAALDGSKEVGFTIVSMTISLAAVFIPVVFMSGIVGRIFREFSMTICAAVLVSGFISLTLTPMLSSRFLRSEHEVKHGHIYDVSEKVFGAMTHFYDVTLAYVLRHKLVTIGISLGILVSTVFLFMGVKKGFIPTEDQPRIMVQTEGPEGISYRAMIDKQKELADILAKNPDVESFMSSAGGRSGGNGGMLFLKLKDHSDGRVKKADEVVADLRRQLNGRPDMKAYPQNPPVIQIGGGGSKAAYQYTLQGPDTTELYDGAKRLQQAMASVPGVVDLNSDLQIKNPQVNIKINRDKAAMYGVTASSIESALYTAYGSSQISTIYSPNNQYQVIMEVQDGYQLNPQALTLLYVHSSSGQLVPLNAVVDVNTGVGPLSVNHTGQTPSVTISFNLQAGVSLSEVTKNIDQLAQSILPATVQTGFQGTAAEFVKSTKSTLVLFLAAVLVIYLVLGILYESFYHPITILSALPFAFFGAFLTLLVFNAELSLYATVGIIMLVGLVKKNGIMMVDFALECQRAGKDAQDAIHEASLVRFRPIMMTTMAALMAGLPIALGIGAGAEARRPLGLVVVGGLIFSQTLTLYVTPVIFVCMERIRVALHGKKAGSVQAAEVDAGEQAA